MKNPFYLTDTALANDQEWKSYSNHSFSAVHFRPYCFSRTFRAVLFEPYSSNRTLETVLFESYGSKYFLEFLAQRTSRLNIPDPMLVEPTPYSSRNTLPERPFGKHSSRRNFRKILFERYSLKDTIRQILFDTLRLLASRLSNADLERIEPRPYSARHTLRGILCDKYSANNTPREVFREIYSTRYTPRQILRDEYYSTNTIRRILFDKYYSTSTIRDIARSEYLASPGKDQTRSTAAPPVPPFWDSDFSPYSPRPSCPQHQGLKQVGGRRLSYTRG